MVVRALATTYRPTALENATGRVKQRQESMLEMRYCMQKDLKLAHAVSPKWSRIPLLASTLCINAHHRCCARLRTAALTCLLCIVYLYHLCTIMHTQLWVAQNGDSERIRT